MTLTPSRPAAQRPLRADAERNRRRILAAAADLFAQRGLDVGLDEIARHAGVGTGTVYRRFPDKAVLIEALFEDRISSMIELAEQGCQHPDPWTGLVSFLETMAERHLADRGLKELLFGDSCPGRSFPDRRAELVPLVDTMVRRAQESGQIRPDLASSDLVLFQIMLSAAGAFSGDVHPQLWRRQLGLLLDGIRLRRDHPSPLPVPPMAPADVELLCRVSPATSNSGKGDANSR